ncbi:MAG: nucleotide sugar dehydrogenase [Nisaea sp.]|jgi:UDP-N-acetyl-D-glucosamine dehydrogenase|uniref:nucleotide sugar dehydrogenase n=1 Tax=Nisaea sp. TaxID=2024842 RepID=UPI001B16CDD9|nr:nucleotide sugar dehydrogenase [Nisaea sp.]MBO6562229.1 nucleotide sugar dehydrogenase [Nisaea sp.]
MSVQAFLDRVAAKEARVGVIGLGYVGLPLALACLRAGFPVTGYDIDGSKVEMLKAERSYLPHIPVDGVGDEIATGRFRPTSVIADLGDADAVLICVPTPLTPERDPDLRYVRDTAAALAPVLKKGALVVLESTTYPGTTEEVLLPILEGAGLKLGEDLFLAFAPEREDPGNAQYSIGRIPKVVGGMDAASGQAAEALYGAVLEKVVPVSSASTAEAVKITENVFRAVNIALVNELKLIYGAMGIDVWEVIEAASTKPFGYMPFYPGPGLGGHCIPIDPFYLAWKARSVGQTTRFIELAGEINRAMPDYVIDRLREAVDLQSGKGLRGADILLIGMAYKKNVADQRESPALTILEKLDAAGASVSFHDPWIPEILPSREFGHLAGRTGVALTAERVAAADAVLIVTDHDDVDYALIADRARLVVDTRNAMRARGHEGDRIVTA